MSLSQALSTASTGLRTTQTGMALIAANVANAETPGYVRKTLVQEASNAGGNASGVRVSAIAREFDQYIQRQLRIESSGGSYADLRAQFYQRLQQLYGAPGAASAIETVFNNFTNSVQALTTSADTSTARSAVLNSARVLTQHLNGMTTDIQALRGDAERGLSDAVAVANEAMRQIASINNQLTAMPASTGASAALQDQRDVLIDRLADLMDIKVVIGESNQANVFTNSGIQLVGARASQFSFNAQGTVTALTQWSADSAESGVGTLMLVSPTGGTLDLIANNAIRAGKIAAYIDMRDNVLVEAQAQLDALAAGMASALSDKAVAAIAATSGPQQGFDIDTAGLLAGNRITLTYTDSGQQRQVTIVRVDDPSALPLSNTFSTNPNDTVIGIEFSAGLAAVASQLNAKFNGKIHFSNPSGSTLRVLDDGLANNTSIDAFAAVRTMTTLNGGSAELPFFTDGQGAYSGAITASGLQSVGFAGRISVNPALAGDPSKLVVFAAGVSAGDPTRPDFIHQALTSASVDFAPNTGIGSTGAPFAGSLPGFMRQVLSQQGGAAEAAARLAEGQSVVVGALQQRVAEQSGVNVDLEMANLLTLQNAYAANARVMSVVREMLELLMNI